MLPHSVKMQETKKWDAVRGFVITREWHNVLGELHRETGPAREQWVVIPGGTHVLSYEGWYLHGVEHREGRPAFRQWRVAGDGTSVLVYERWQRHGRRHRLGGPAIRRWAVDHVGRRTLAGELWSVNNKRHRVDGPTHLPGPFFWYGGTLVRQKDLPWLRRGRHLLAAFTGATTRQQGDGGGGGVFPAWCKDARVTMTGAALYTSVVGGTVFLCV